ncbi:Maf family protein [Asaia krungthepensis]|uniref:Nucleoside triphosphate pyrophosphatase n=1 Tax=Asaia krungthepensis NRIC 0535 TaxID=1307925 RepID=A0ABQ0Q478_9PROT|nr:Maf family protein [Asaia krungthepensis]GBQ90614.1 septum formation inhibitor nucleotide-binding protein Maf [Asaia krungthepensis NRIC 0535]
MESQRRNPGQSRLVLASGSTARLGLLRGAGLDVLSCPVGFDEAVLRDALRAKNEAHGTIALALANAKSLEFSRNPQFMSADFVIAADQILECDGVGFDKPENPEEARRQLRQLKGRTHHLHTATVLYRDGKKLWQHLVAPRLTMRDFSDAFLERYLKEEGEALLSCVGAYRLEGRGVQLFEKIDGDHDAILGLPRLPLLAVLRDLGAIEG